MMRLSEAIRLGAISCKWGQGNIVMADGSRCALGMAAYAIGRDDIVLTDKAVNLWPWIKDEAPGGGMIATRIVGMNDCKTKTPFQIADWVEELECERGMWDDLKAEEHQQEVKPCPHSLPASV